MTLLTGQPVTGTLVVGSTAGPPLTGLLRDALADRDDIVLVDVDEVDQDDAWERRPDVVLHGFRQEPLPPGWMSQVRWVHVPSVGIDWVADGILDGRLVSGARGVAAAPIAEYVLHALLTEAKGDLWVHTPWTHGQPPARGPAQLGGATVGLVGLGAIGVAVANLLVPFGTRVLAVRASSAPSPLLGVEVLGSLEELLPEVDHLVLALPATHRTVRIIGDEALRRVRPGVHLVNIARGSLVDHDALQRALDDGRVRAATLDVTDPEPPPADHWLLSHPRVRVSPHLSYLRRTTYQDLVDRFVENLDRFGRGEQLLGIIDPARGY